ncbi:MAG: hypothetical protein V4714_11685 [Bacteroidota bacterium]
MNKYIETLKDSAIDKVDFFGGKASRYEGALNVDTQAERGFKGTIDDFI